MPGVRVCAPQVDLIKATPEADVLRRDVYDRPPIFRWASGNVALLGDSAHAMQPNLGQGASGMHALTKASKCRAHALCRPLSPSATFPHGPLPCCAACSPIPTSQCALSAVHAPACAACPRLLCAQSVPSPACHCA